MYSKVLLSIAVIGLIGVSNDAHASRRSDQHWQRAEDAMGRSQEQAQRGQVISAIKSREEALKETLAAFDAEEQAERARKARQQGGKR